MKIADLEHVGVGCRCGEKMERQVTVPHIFGDFAGYECPVTGRWVEGRRQHEDNLKRTGCRLLEPGETEQYVRDKGNRQKELDKAVETAVQTTAQELGINF